MTADPRTSKQVRADRLDLDIFNLAAKLETAGYADAAQHVLRARTDVRRDMCRADREATSEA